MISLFNLIKHYDARIKGTSDKENTYVVSFTDKADALQFALKTGGVIGIISDNTTFEPTTFTPSKIIELLNKDNIGKGFTICEITQDFLTSYVSQAFNKSNTGYTFDYLLFVKKLNSLQEIIISKAEAERTKSFIVLRNNKYYDYYSDDTAHLDTYINTYELCVKIKA